MAITEIQTPTNTFLPAYNDIYHLINSTNKAQSNFKYLFKVFVDGVYIGKTWKVTPDPTYGFGLFDVKRCVQTAVTYDIDLGLTGLTGVTNNNATYYIQYGEEYGDLSSGVTQYSNLLQSSTRYVFAGSIRTLENLDYVDDNYIMDSSGSTFMTNQPRPFRIFEDQKCWLGMMDDTASHVKTLVVRTYDSTGSIIQTVHIRNSEVSALFLRGITGYNMNDIDSSELLAGAQPIITDSVSYYTVQAGTDSPNPYGLSELMRYNIDRSCDWDDSYDIYFQNVFGWFDSFRFTRSNTKGHDINKKFYKQSTGQFGASSFTVAKTDRAKTQYYTDYDDKWTLRSAWLTQAESTWLLELVTSPQVFINVNNELIPVTISQSNYNERKRTEAEIFNLEIVVDFSVKNYRQRY